jgi:hypothetical protein
MGILVCIPVIEGESFPSTDQMKSLDTQCANDCGKLRIRRSTFRLGDLLRLLLLRFRVR